MPAPADPLPRTRQTAAFERRAASVLARAIPAGERVVVACSGGPDSTAAAVASARWAARAGADVTLAVFDHRARGPAAGAAEREAVETLGAALRVRVSSGASVAALRGEADARRARYAWLRTVLAAAGSTHLVTGHTLDDQAETVLLRLARGTGLRGAAGMAERAPWPLGTGAAAPSVVRPLLGITRREIARYLDALGVIGLEDESNRSLRYARNRVRHEALPALRAVNDRAAEHLAAFASRAAADAEALDQWAEAVIEADAAIGPRGVAISRSALRALPPAVSSRVLQRAAALLGLALGEAQLAQTAAALSRRGARTTLAGGEVVVDADTVAVRVAPDHPSRNRQVGG